MLTSVFRRHRHAKLLYPHNLEDTGACLVLGNYSKTSTGGETSAGSKDGLKRGVIIIAIKQLGYGEEVGVWSGGARHRTQSAVTLTAFHRFVFRVALLSLEGAQRDIHGIN